MDAIDSEDTSGLNGSRLAATVLLLRDGEAGLEVWVQERVSTMEHFPGHVVFPGGGVDSRDFPPRRWHSGDLWFGKSVVAMAHRMGINKYKAHALVFAAARELFEEAGALLTVSNGISTSDAARYHENRELLEGHVISFTEFLTESELQVDADRLLPWARWVGQTESKQWFDTFFFLGKLPEGQYPDGNTGEADDANWFTASLLIEGWRAGLVRLAAPTWAQINRLAQFDTVAEAFADASYSDLRPVIGDPEDDPRFAEYFHTNPIDRIKWRSQ